MERVRLQTRILILPAVLAFMVSILAMPIHAEDSSCTMGEFESPQSLESTAGKQIARSASEMSNEQNRKTETIDADKAGGKQLVFAAGQKILFIGDSITDAERRADVQIVYDGETIAGTYPEPYGYGYVNMVRNMLMARYPELHLQFVNKGIGGNGSPELLARWDKDVIPENPDWVSILIGIGDVTRYFTPNPEAGVSPAQYEANLRQMIESTKKATGGRVRFILMEPFLIQRNRHTKEVASLPSSISGHPDVWRLGKDIDKYCQVVQKLAVEYDAVLVRTQQAWDMTLAQTKDSDWTPDAVHPYPNNTPGYAVIALAFLKAVGFEW